MSWPKGRPRPKKASPDARIVHEQEAIEVAESAEMFDVTREPIQVPPDWTVGMLLNVRNRGDAYVVTLYPEEYSDEHPERALRFTNPSECQDFVSTWYARQSHDPRAR